jgi:hypothetical protein
LTFSGGYGAFQCRVQRVYKAFAADQFRLVADGLIGSNGIYADSLSHSGIYQNISYSVGQYHYQTDGFRENNDLAQNIYNAFIQANCPTGTACKRNSATPMMSAAIEICISIPIFFQRAERNRRFSIDSLGFRHGFSPNATFLAPMCTGR